MKKILCKLGFHKWLYWHRSYGGIQFLTYYRDCINCDAKQARNLFKDKYTRWKTYKNDENFTSRYDPYIRPVKSNANLKPTKDIFKDWIES